MVIRARGGLVLMTLPSTGERVRIAFLVFLLGRAAPCQVIHPNNPVLEGGADHMVLRVQRLPYRL